jgi:hypothetical protein
MNTPEPGNVAGDALEHEAEVLGAHDRNRHLDRSILTQVASALQQAQSI